MSEKPPNEPKEVPLASPRDRMLDSVGREASLIEDSIRVRDAELSKITKALTEMAKRGEPVTASHAVGFALMAMGAVTDFFLKRSDESSR